MNGSVRQTEFINLKEHVNYNITVFASTVKGDGPASNPIVVRTDQDSKYIFVTGVWTGYGSLLQMYYIWLKYRP